jgi:hypothetical protein
MVLNDLKSRAKFSDKGGMGILIIFDYVFKLSEQKMVQGVRAHCTILLKYLHPNQKIYDIIPLNACRNKQELSMNLLVTTISYLLC